jgi:hypothetical protein
LGSPLLIVASRNGDGGGICLCWIIARFFSLDLQLIFLKKMYLSHRIFLNAADNMEQRFKAVHDALKRTNNGTLIWNVIDRSSLTHPLILRNAVSKFSNKDIPGFDSYSIAKIPDFFEKMEDKKAKKFIIEVAKFDGSIFKTMFEAIRSDKSGKTIMDRADFNAFAKIVKKGTTELPTFKSITRPDISESELLCELITLFKTAIPEDTESLSILEKQLDETNKEELHKTVLAQQAEIDQLKEMISQLQKTKRVAFAEGTKEDNPSPGKKHIATTKEANVTPAKKMEVAGAKKAAPTKKGKTDLKEKGKETAALAEESTDDEEIPQFIVSFKPDPDAYLGSQQTPSGSITLTEGGTQPLDD